MLREQPQLVSVRTAARMRNTGMMVLMGIFQTPGCPVRGIPAKPFVLNRALPRRFALSPSQDHVGAEPVYINIILPDAQRFQEPIFPLCWP